MSRTERSRKSPKASGEPGDARASSGGETAPAGLTGLDLHLFNEGTHRRIWEKLGAHPAPDGAGARFGVWAPSAERVAVVGDFNDWDAEAHPLETRGRSGIWEGVVRGAERGHRYKYLVHSRYRGYREYKADPVGFRHETPPASASVVWDLDYEWGDGEWMEERSGRSAERRPVSVYEVHPGSWRRKGEGGERPLTYRELAPRLAEYVKDTGFTHVELLPVMEHPFYGSWGYQVTGYFAPTARYGSPQDFMYLVDHLHQEGIGVILDWVPSHFPADAHGLAYFDGTHLYEHADPRQGYHPDWNSLIFNYGRPEVRSFLLSSGLFWLDAYHADGLRVDAVASMLYLDYSREEGEWIPNRYGGRENLEAIELLRQLNTAVREESPGAFTVAEESTAWPDVSRPASHGGLGFDMKWDMGWMHDTLEYMEKDPVHRKYHHDRLTFRQLYAWSEDFMLPLSHDEVVHGKGSLLEKMPGDEWQKFANLRLLLGYQWAQPGKKLLFMGGEFGQRREWRHDESLDWHLLQQEEAADGDPRHRGVQRWVRDLNRAYREHPGLHDLEFEPGGFEWVVADDRENSVLAFLRKDRSSREIWLVAANFTPVPRENYRVGVPRGGRWEESLNSDSEVYGGSGRGNLGGVEASPLPRHGRSHSVTLHIPPLAILFLRSGPDVGPT